MAMLVVLICTSISFALAPLFEPTNLAMVYLAGVVAVALTHGRGPSILATIAGVATFDVLFVTPYGTFAVSDSQYLLTFAIMLATGLVISELTARVRLHALRQEEREQRTAALLALSKELATLPTRDAVISKSRRMIEHALDVDVWIVGPEATELRETSTPPTSDLPPAAELGVIRWVIDHKRPAGRGTDTLPGTATTYLPLTVTSGLVGVLGVRPRQRDAALGLAQRDLLQAFAGQIAGALERCGLAELAEQTRLQIQTERLRNSLLSTVSHDLRTPLATITGAASTLVEQPQLDCQRRHELVESIFDESERLNRLVANLLDLTRLEARAIALHKELQPIEEVVGVVLARLERTLRDNPVSLQIDPNLPPVAIDALLMQQVLVNLLDNAVRFSPNGSPIDLSCHEFEGRMIIEVADRGPGFPAGETQRIFDKFYCVPGQTQTGTGIGLAICRGIVELHGGTITADNRAGGGAAFRISLPLA
jgi:two-component system sensor histidine kinase KdpD